MAIVDVIDDPSSGTRVVGCYLWPAVLLAPPRDDDPFGVTRVEWRAEVSGLEVLVTANGGLWTAPPGPPQSAAGVVVRFVDMEDDDFGFLRRVCLRRAQGWAGQGMGSSGFAESLAPWSWCGPERLSRPARVATHYLAAVR